jgi:hypothetical protein
MAPLSMKQNGYAAIPPSTMRKIRSHISLLHVDVNSALGIMVDILNICVFKVNSTKMG